MSNNDDFPYTFTVNACQSCKGQCCRGETGYVWLNEQELGRLAQAKGMTINAFTSLYVRSVQGKNSLRELMIKGEYLCCLFDTEKSQCQVYDHRPQQCRRFPFWEEFKGNIEPLLAECPGIQVKASN